MAMSEYATWADLPIEIVDQIVALCDTPALLTLSYLNTQLNTLALDLLFKRENVTNPKQGYVVSRLAAPQVVPALNAALWLNRLPHVTYYLNPDVKRLFSEVRGLERLVGRVRDNDRLDLYFSSVDRWFADSFPRSRAEESMEIDSLVWRTIFVRLLETALKKGCRSMRVEGAHKLQCHYIEGQSVKSGEGTTARLPVIVSPQPTLPPTAGRPAAAPIPDWAPSEDLGPTRPFLNKASARKRLVRWVKKRLGLKVASSQLLNSKRPTQSTPTIQATTLLMPQPAPKTAPPSPLPTPAISSNLTPDSSSVTDSTAVDLEKEPCPASFHTSKPCLKTFNLRSSMMLQPLFFSDTLNLIRAHSSTLETLELVSIKVAEDVWTTLFDSLDLPVLETFVYLYDTLIVEEPLVAPKLLLSFFTRHPSLKTLELYGVKVGGQGKDAEVEFPSVQEGLLPNLIALDAHPRIVSWLLQWPKGCPKLAQVTLTSEYTASRFLVIIPSLNPYEAFDTGLLTLSSLLTSTAPYPPEPSYVTTVGDLRPLHLQLKFSTEHFLLDWFLSHTSTLPPETSILDQLINVHKLTISAHYHTRFEIEHKQVLPRFLGLLPNLKELVLTELPYPEEIRDDAVFITNVKASAKNLERFTIGRNVVWDLQGHEGSVSDDDCW